MSTAVAVQLDLGKPVSLDTAPPGLLDGAVALTDASRLFWPWVAIRLADGRWMVQKAGVALSGDWMREWAEAKPLAALKTEVRIHSEYGMRTDVSPWQLMSRDCPRLAPLVEAVDGYLAVGTPGLKPALMSPDQDTRLLALRLPEILRPLAQTDQ